MTPYDILKAGYNAELADHIIKSFSEIQTNYVLKKWKPSELDAGHFVEAARRTIDFVFRGAYTPFNTSLPKFTDAELARYERETSHESYRMLIPRALKAIYNIRNKRGVAHVSDVDPNEMDATYILYTTKWIVAELIRLKSSLSPAHAQQLVNSVVERQIPLLWKEADIETILVPGMPTSDQVLVLLYDKSPRTVLELQQITEYKNTTNFKKILRRLHDKKFVYLSADESCRLTPVGVGEAELLITKHK